jgi:hypothetical protein
MSGVKDDDGINGYDDTREWRERHVRLKKDSKYSENMDQLGRSKGEERCSRAIGG